MNDKLFSFFVLGIALAFTVFFGVTVVPPLLADFDVIGALMAGFVNPYAAGYSTDVILCWLLLAVWVSYEALVYRVRHGWLCLLLGLAPGVAVGFGLYLWLRQKQLTVANKTTP